MKKSLGLILFFILPALLPATSHAFKWDKCKKVYSKWDITPSKSKNVGVMVLEASVQITSQVSTQSSTSTTSYVSSSGECKAFGMAEAERHQYIAETMTELKAEAAEGQGEHVESLATLYGCSATVRPQFYEMMKSNHAKIFSNEISSSTGLVTRQITDTVMNDQVLRQNCNLEKI